MEGFCSIWAEQKVQWAEVFTKRGYMPSNWLEKGPLMITGEISSAFK